MSQAINFAAVSADYHTPELQRRVADFNAKAGVWLKQRSALYEKVTLADCKPVYTTDANGRRVAVGGESWIKATTFPTGAEACAMIEDLRRQRIEVPVAGLHMLAELEAIRDEAQRQWEAHAASLKAALAKVEAEVRAEAAAFVGLSDAARATHIADRTTAAQKAAAITNPTPTDWWGWGGKNLGEYRATLLNDLRETFARYV